MNCFASACTAGEAFASIPIAPGRSVTGVGYSTRSFESPSFAPIPAELWTSASLIWPLVRAWSVGPFVGLMTRPFAFSFAK